MLIIISDLHFQDTCNDTIFDDQQIPITVERNVSADAFKLVFDDILATAKCNKAKELIIVLAGDIVDLNRSQKWFDRKPSQKEDVRPYGDHSPEVWYPIVDEILRGIIESNAQTFQEFREFKKRVKKELEFDIVYKYLPGNHDRLVNLHQGIRAEIGSQLLGENKTEYPKFDHIYDGSESYGVFVRHGHEYDDSNFTGKIPPTGIINVNLADYDLAPLGDYTTIDIAVGLAVEYRLLYQSKILAGDLVYSDIYCKLLEFDDVRSDAGIMDFLKIETNPQIDVWKYISPAADVIIRRALKSSFLKSKVGFIGKIFPLLNLLPTKLIPTKAILNFASNLSSSRQKPWEYAQRENILNVTEGRYIVTGHTHDPRVEFLRYRSDGKELFYFNTGTWRQQIRKCQDGKTFGSAKALTYVIFYSNNEDPNGSAKGYSFDYWSGYTKKEQL
jgi:UDP-2,3-diacylglucosamine pyrophosphatase LpxH